MTIVEYAEKLGYRLNSAQITILEKTQEAKENNRQLFIYYPRQIGRMMMADIIEKYNKL